MNTEVSNRAQCGLNTWGKMSGVKCDKRIVCNRTTMIVHTR